MTAEVGVAETMVRDLILVGAGAYFKDLAAPSVRLMQQRGAVGTFITVETQPIDGSDLHVVREPQQPLSAVVDDLVATGKTPERPLVLLAHPNHLHTPESADLLKNARSKPDVLIEKPYAITVEQMIYLDLLLDRHMGRVGTLEYYLTMKGVPLLLAGGVVRPGTFYWTEPVLKLRSDRTLDQIAGSLRESIGDPLYVVSDVLEGEGSYGTIAHRNSSLVDARQGGGMIQDLGHHALSPLLALQDYLGTLSLVDVRTAFCDTYERFAIETFGIPPEHIGESFAKMRFTTDRDVDVDVAVGKYVENGTNQRRIVITGTRGVMIYDMTKNVLSIQRGDAVDKTVPLLEADKSGAPKYYPVIRAAVDTMNGNNPFTFEPFDVAMDAQRYVFNILEDAQAENHPRGRTHYRAGTMHDEIL